MVVTVQSLGCTPCTVREQRLKEVFNTIMSKSLTRANKAYGISKFGMTSLWIFGLLLIALPARTTALSSPISKVSRSISNGLQQRLAADPSFAMKSFSELVLAAGSQFAAEWSRRGAANLVPELDFVVAGVLTAMAGKYYSMWRVAPTRGKENGNLEEGVDITFAGVPVPTNAFQPTMLDGKTSPRANQRLLALFAPMPSLFRAGIIASAMGYGFTATIIWLRSMLLPNFVTATRNVNVVYASVYTGVFMAIVSNIRYQVLQGIIEPKIIDQLRKYPALHSMITFGVRMANGFLGSVIAIAGMRYLGLQQRK